MQCRAWMLVLFTGAFVGCGGSAATNPAAQSSAIKEIVVPAEVAAQFERGEIANAVETLTELMAKSPKDESLLSLRATARHRLGQNKEALADLDQAISMNPRDPKLYNNRGFIRLGMEQFQDALHDFNKATELAPGYMNAYNNRGLLYIALKQYPEAIEQFDRALVIDNRYIDAYNNRGFAQLEAGLMEQALDDFNTVIQLNPEYVNAYNNRGLLRARAGDYENAIIDFTQAMMLDPMNPKYYEHRCEVYQRRGALDKALADDKKIGWLIDYHQLTAKVAANTHPVRELTDRAKHFLDVDHREKALTDLDRALELDPRCADALVTRASVHLRQKSMSQARADAEASLSVQPTQEAYSILGDVFLSLKDYDKAIENFAKARRVDPMVAEAFYAKSKVLVRQGKSEAARDILDQALALDPDIEKRLR